jgi:hypothetical protein
MDKKGQSSGFAWIIGLIFLFALGLGFVIFNQVMTTHIEPMSNDLITASPYLNSTEVAELEASNAKYMAFWHSLPFIIVFLIAIYFIATSFRKGDQK